MLNKAEEIIDLFEKHLKGELSPADKTALDDLLKGSADVRLMFEKINADEDFIHKLTEYYNKATKITDEDIQAAFERSLEPAKVISIDTSRKRYFKWVAAACFVLFISVTSYFLLFDKPGDDKIVITPVETSIDVPPGTFKAKLTLDDGSTIFLDKASTGEITKQGDATILNQNGELVYTSSSTGTSSRILFNTLSTGRGETYPTILSDGSKVWLNNETTLRYPVSFTGSSRVVELSGGEAYFEVAHNTAKPFKVVVNGTEVEVLGTKFAIRAFGNENTIKTSLLTGKVKVAPTNNAAKILTPGQQANVGKDGKITVVKDADVQGSIAWVNGFFHFEDEDLTSVLRQLGRWYDVEFVVSGKLSEDGNIHGEVERNIPLSKVLSNLERMTGTKFKMEGKKVIVNP